MVIPAEFAASRSGTAYAGPAVAGGAHRPPPSLRDAPPIPCLGELWAETRGDPEVCIAVLDGPVDLTHPALRGAGLTVLETLVPAAADRGPACRHGTHVASLIFGRHDGPVPGVAPRCRGLIVPIFQSTGEESVRPCSQLDLARAITQAVAHGAQIVNISGGEFAPAGTASPLLADVVARCARRGVLLVAATGNQGCECLHVPAALESVLAVGAMDARGTPLPFSNWGDFYQGILAPGEELLGARPGGGTVRATGTSYAAALVSGVAGLLVSLQRQRGERPDPRRVRQALLQGARGCAPEPETDCRRLLAGRLNVQGAVSFLFRGTLTMSEPNEVSATGAERGPTDPRSDAPGNPPPSAPPRLPAAGVGAVQPSACASCEAAAGKPQLVYAIGTIGYDFVSEARLDSVGQKMAGVAEGAAAARGLALDPARMLAHLERDPWDAAAIEWTLSLDGTPIYAIRPAGPFAAHGYRQLQDFLRHRLDGVDRFSIAGVVAGRTSLFMGQQVVPVVVPELRAMYSWTTAALAEAVVGPRPAARAPARAREEHERRTATLQNFLVRVYHELRNLGTAPEDRAINFAATNAFEIGRIYETALRENMELDSTKVVPNPVAPPGSDRWDVEVYFFYPERQVQTVRRVFRFTVDVSDVVPVTVGPVRTWFTR
jgi:hypothetical protein